MRIRPETELNKRNLCKRISLSMGYGTEMLITKVLDDAGINNRSKWIEKTLRDAAIRIEGERLAKLSLYQTLRERQSEQHTA